MSSNFSNRRRGATLLEIAIVLGIVIILVSVAVATLNPLPRVRVLEARLMLDGMAKQIVATDLEDKIETNMMPVSAPGKTLRPMPDKLNVGEHAFGPDGDVRCSYGAVTDATKPNVLYLLAACDVDGDGVYRVLVRTVSFSSTFSPDLCDGMVGYKLSGAPASTAAALLAQVGHTTACGVSADDLSSDGIF